jgi:hypothetical protein
MQNVGLVLLVFSFVFGCIASFFGPAIWARAHFGWLAFTFFVAAELFGGLTKVFH